MFFGGRLKANILEDFLVDAGFGVVGAGSCVIGLIILQLQCFHL